MFNLIPVYPLDGGKVIKGIFKNKKHFKVFNCVIKSLLIAMFTGLFICSCFNEVNFFYMIMALFFLTLTEIKTPTLTVFKFNKKTKTEKIVMLKISSNETLFSLLKK